MSREKDKPFEPFDSFDQFFEQAERRPEYWVERAKLEFTREALSEMQRGAVSKGELASRLGVQPGMVTRLLSGNNNFELATMVRIAQALNCEFRCHLQPVGTKAEWINFLSDEPQRKSPIGWNPDDFTVEKTMPPEKLVNHEPVPTAT